MVRGIAHILLGRSFWTYGTSDNSSETRFRFLSKILGSEAVPWRVQEKLSVSFLIGISSLQSFCFEQGLPCICSKSAWTIELSEVTVNWYNAYIYHSSMRCSGSKQSQLPRETSQTSFWRMKTKDVPVSRKRKLITSNLGAYDDLFDCVHLLEDIPNTSLKTKPQSP